MDSPRKTYGIRPGDARLFLYPAIARISQEEVFLLRVRKDVASLLGSPPRTAPSPPRGGQVGRAVSPPCPHGPHLRKPSADGAFAVPRRAGWQGGFSALPAWAAEVVSSNIVGYQKVTLQPGFNFVAPQFTAVGGGAIDLQSIKLDIDDSLASGGDNIQILDDGGSTVATYYWMPAYAFGGTQSGWFDADVGDLADVTIANGLSVLVDSTDDLTVTVSGEVSTNDTEVDSVAGFNFVGNSTPVAINIQDIQIDLDDSEATGGDNIQILDDGGATLATYYWMPAYAFGGTKSGWFDADVGDLADVDLDPGQGVLLDATADGITITVPSAIQ